MALETVTDKTQQPPASTDGSSSLYDQIMAGPPVTTAAPESAAKPQDVPPAPGATTTLDRTTVPETAVDSTAKPPTAKSDAVTAPAPGDTPVAPPAAKDSPTPPIATDVPAPPPGTVTDVPAVPGAVPPQVEGVEDKGNCDFKPDFEYKTEHGRAWKAVSDQQRHQPLEVNERGRYQVVYGDSLSTIAERNLKSSGLAADRKSVEAEVQNIVNANKNRYPSLDCNNHFIKTGWTLDLPRHQPGDAPQQPPVDQRPPVERPPVERPPAQPPRVERPPAVEVVPRESTVRHEHRHDGSGNVNIGTAHNVKIIYGQDGPPPRVVANDRPYYPPRGQDYPQDQPVIYRDRPPVYQPDYPPDYPQDYPQRRHRPPVIIDARIDTGWDRPRWEQPRWEQPRWQQQSRWGNQPPWNDDCFGTGQNDNWRFRQNPRISIDFGHDSRRSHRGIPNFDGRSMPYFGGNRGGYRSNGISFSVRI